MDDDEPATLEALLSVLATQPPGWLFRGQENFAWNLVTRLERDLRQWPEQDANDAAKFGAEAEAVNTFAAKARHLITTIELDDYVGWLSVMQHYGAPTRLLDWTRSPFVACYFACAGTTTTDGAIWMLNESECHVAHGNFYPQQAGFKAFAGSQGSHSISHTAEALDRQARAVTAAMLNKEQWPVIVVPHIIDDRIRVQQGVFTFHGDLLDLDAETLWRVPKAHAGGDASETDLHAAFRSQAWSRAIKQGPKAFVRKIRVKAGWRRELYRVLQRMNITPDVLFPGLDGIGRAATLQVQHGEALESFQSHKAMEAFFQRSLSEDLDA